MPLRAFVAGLFLSFMFSIPASLKEPDFFTCSVATPMNASTTPFTSFVFNPVVSATDWYTPPCVIAPPVFMAFIAGMLKGKGSCRRPMWGRVSFHLSPH